MKYTIRNNKFNTCIYLLHKFQKWKFREKKFNLRLVNLKRLTLIFFFICFLLFVFLYANAMLKIFNMSLTSYTTFEPNIYHQHDHHQFWYNNIWLTHWACHRPPRLCPCRHTHTGHLSNQDYSYRYRTRKSRYNYISHCLVPVEKEKK